MMHFCKNGKKLCYLLMLQKLNCRDLTFQTCLDANQKQQQQQHPRLYQVKSAVQWWKVQYFQSHRMIMMQK